MAEHNVLEGNHVHTAPQSLVSLTGLIAARSRIGEHQQAAADHEQTRVQLEEQRHILLANRAAINNQLLHLRTQRDFHAGRVDHYDHRVQQSDQQIAELKGRVQELAALRDGALERVEMYGHGLATLPVITVATLRQMVVIVNEIRPLGFGGQIMIYDTPMISELERQEIRDLCAQYNIIVQN
ncbi:hypothetical protein ABKV19_023940 [Rosa sericea]